MKPEDFLLKEYEHFSDSLHKNEELGERRVNFFLSLTTAIIAGVIALMTFESDKTAGFGYFQKKEDLQFLAGLMLFGTFALGIVTLIRLLRRNTVTDELIARLKYIVEEIKKQSPDLTDYKAFKLRPKGLLTGGLADIVACLNSTVFSLFFGINMDDQDLSLLIFSFVFSFLIQVVISFNWRKKQKKQLENNDG